MSQSNLFDLIFSDVFEPIKLHNLLFLHGVNLEVHVFYDYLFLEIINLFLFHFCLFFHHVVARNKHGFEVVGLRESCTLALDFSLEVWFAILTWNEVKGLFKNFGLLILNVFGYLQVIDGRLCWLFGMLVPILTLKDGVETSLCLPTCFVLFLCLELDLVFINKGEC